LNVQSQNIKKDATESPSGQHESASTLPKEQQTSGSLVDRLRDRAYSMYRKDALCEEAASEIERLQRQLATRECNILKHSLLELIEKWDSQALLGGCSSGLDSETDRKSAATQGSAHSCCQPFKSAPVTSGPVPAADGISWPTSGAGPVLTDAEREAIEWYASFLDGIHADTLRKLLERTKCPS
jgi:hypothetical protein